MLAVLLAIQVVIEDVDGAGSRAKAEKSEGSSLQGEGIEDSLGENQGGENENVLRPVSGSHQSDELSSHRRYSSPTCSPT